MWSRKGKDVNVNEKILFAIWINKKLSENEVLLLRPLSFPVFFFFLISFVDIKLVAIYF